MEILIISFCPNIRCCSSLIYGCFCISTFSYINGDGPFISFCLRLTFILSTANHGKSCGCKQNNR